MTNKKELPKTYSPKEVEAEWGKIWEEGKYFKPRSGKTGKAYSIVMPLPNVTGKLHMGHALDATTQDTLTRYKRMKGFETLWIPGMDHAGIATQSVVEKLVYQQEGKTRHEFTKEEFLKKIWEWKNEFGGIIAKQQRALGVSPDWDYFMFTLDKEANQAVCKSFVDLYNEGLIYQSDYIINWDPVLQSAISDAEVEHKDIKGSFYHIHYKVKDSNEILEIATTRPETMLGDTAVAVHPDDDRFKHLIGKTAIIPICNREIPIIADKYVSIEKGTGCLKVTPGHDFNDFEIGLRHNLPIITILNLDGTMNKHGMEFEGMTCQDARKKIVKKLKELKSLTSIKEHIHPVGHGDRSKSIIEPMVSKQWFLNVHQMAKKAVTAVQDGTTKFFPKSWENTYFAWLKEPKNWCISRQLWWGHQIPIFYCKKCGNTWAEIEKQTKCNKCNSTDIFQDPDVLDTWFSSGLWPLTTLGWPDKERMKEKKFDTFYPTSTLVTGYDIIFFWVARMMMMDIKTVGSAPFENVYLHAIVRDSLGRKMSKSLDNGIDPMDMIDKYGADALRFTLAAGSGYNRNLNLDPERINGYKHFINKVWNAFRFIHPFLENTDNERPYENKLDHHERWILSELNSVTKDMNDSLDEFRFDDTCLRIYSFVYDKFCSLFIELSKNLLHGENQEKKKQRATVLKFTFRKIMALLHPVVPYITEELWSHLKNKDEDLLIVNEYPEFEPRHEFVNDQEKMNKFVDVITIIRNLRSSVNIKPKEEIEVALFSNNKKLLEYFNDSKTSFSELARVKNIKTFSKEKSRPGKSIMMAATHTEVFVYLDGVIDIQDQVKRLQKELTKIQKEHDKMEAKLGNQKFRENAPEEIIDEVKMKTQDFKEKILSINKSLENFQA